VTAKKGVGGLWYWALPSGANAATEQQHRHSADGGGVVGQAIEGDRQVRDLKDAIARQQETVRVLASTGQSTAEAEQVLAAMGEELEAVPWRLRRSDQ